MSDSHDVYEALGEARDAVERVWDLVREDQARKVSTVLPPDALEQVQECCRKYRNIEDYGENALPIRLLSLVEDWILNPPARPVGEQREP